MIDRFGRDITVITANDIDTYSAGGISVSYPTGTSAEVALMALNAMAPAGWVEPPAVPASVPLWAVRCVLAERGLLDAANAAVASAEGPVRVIWEYGNFVDRDSPALAALAEALGITAADLDAMFISADGLKV